MDPLTLLAIAKGGVGLISGLFGAHEMSQARQLEAQNVRPVETVPQGVRDEAELAKLMASVGMPSAEYNRALQEIRRSGSTAIAAARDKRSTLEALPGVQQNITDAELKLSGASAEERRQNQMNYLNVLSQLGNWQDKVWQWNQAQKYIENAAAIRALKGAGYANINTMLDQIASGATQYATLKSGAGGTGGVAAGDIAGQELKTGPGLSGIGSSIDLSSITGGLSGNTSTLESGAPTYTDPTISQPDLYGGDQSGAYLEYLKKIANL